MDSRGGGKPFGSGANTSLSSKGKNAVGSSGPAVEQLSQGVADMVLDSAQDDGENDEVKKESDEDEDDDALDDTDDELLSEDFDSDTSQQSFETRKKSRWFKKFFDSLSVEDINEPARQWHNFWMRS